MEFLKKHKVAAAVVGIVVFSFIIGNTSGSSAPANTQGAAVYQAVQQPIQSADLSNNNYYTNSVGNTVHAPAYTTDNSVPAGASARCRDGSFSFSQHRSGTCSHHGGVAEWL